MERLIEEIVLSSPELALLFGIPGTMQHPLEVQRDRLGLDDEEVRKLKAGSLLDVGCGGGELVYFLRAQGVEAEGIDPKAPGGEFFMRQSITAEYPWEGSVMRPDGSYDVIVAHTSNQLANAFSTQMHASRKVYERLSEKTPLGRLLMDAYDLGKEDSYKTGCAIISEVMRLLKKGGRFIFSSYLDLLEEKLGNKLEGFRIEKQPIKSLFEIERTLEGDPRAIAIVKSYGHEVKDGALFPDHFKHRTVLYKE